MRDPAQNKAKHLDMEIWLGRHRAHRCRLIATRLSPQHRRQRHRDSKRHQATASKRGLIQDGWSPIITNVSSAHLDSLQVYKLYSARWSIEMQFRAMKQSNQLHHSLNHQTDPLLIEALVLAVLIHQLLTIELQTRINRGIADTGDVGRISIEKLSDAFSHHFLTRNQSNKREPFRYDLRHLAHEKRKRLTLYASTIQSLT